MAPKAKRRNTVSQTKGLADRPQNGGQQNRNDDENAAHGGRARLFQVRLRSVFANVLANLDTRAASE